MRPSLLVMAVRHGEASPALHEEKKRVLRNGEKKELWKEREAAVENGNGLTMEVMRSSNVWSDALAAEFFSASMVADAWVSVIKLSVIWKPSAAILWRWRPVAGPLLNFSRKAVSQGWCASTTRSHNCYIRKRGELALFLRSRWQSKVEKTEERKGGAAKRAVAEDAAFEGDIFKRIGIRGEGVLRGEVERNRGRRNRKGAREVQRRARCRMRLGRAFESEARKTKTLSRCIYL